MIPIMCVELYASSQLHEVVGVSTYCYVNDSKGTPTANMLVSNAV